MVVKHFFVPEKLEISFSESGNAADKFLSKKAYRQKEIYTGIKEDIKSLLVSLGSSRAFLATVVWPVLTVFRRNFEEMTEFANISSSGSFFLNLRTPIRLLGSHQGWWKKTEIVDFIVRGWQQLADVSV